MILMLNCSYKGKKSNTRYFFDVLAAELRKREAEREQTKVGLEREATAGNTVEYEIVNIKDVLTGDIELFVKRLKDADALIIGAPLYVDGLPAQAVKLMEELLEHHKGQFPDLPVYVISNLGFYESIQIKNLLAIVRNWCARMGMTYGGGIAIGAGPMFSALRKMPVHRWPNQKLGNAMKEMAEAVMSGNVMDDCYLQSGIPRWGYVMAAHRMFGQEIKKNCGK